MKKTPLLAFVLVLAAALSEAALDPGEGASSAGLRKVELALPDGGLRELSYRGTHLVEERLVDRTGALIEESLYKEGASAPYEKRAYVRSATGRLLRIEARDASGALVGSLDYRYDKEGRLLGVAPSGVLGGASAGMLSAGGSPQGAWTVDPGTTTVFSYDGRGRQIDATTIRNGTAIAVEHRDYGEGAFPSKIETKDLLSDATTIAFFDDSGRISSKIVSESGRETARVAYIYDANGRLVEESTSYRSGGFTSRTLYYDADGALRREETRRDGSLVGAVEYIEGGRIEELYRGGRLFVKATYLAGRKVKDEFFADGVPIRVKESE